MEIILRGTGSRGQKHKFGLLDREIYTDSFFYIVTRVVLGTAQLLGTRFLPPTDSLCTNEPTINKNSLYGRAIVLTNWKLTKIHCFNP